MLILQTRRYCYHPFWEDLGFHFALVMVGQSHRFLKTKVLVMACSAKTFWDCSFTNKVAVFAPCCCVRRSLGRSCFTTFCCSCGTFWKRLLALVSFFLLWRSDTISSLPHNLCGLLCRTMVVKTSLSNCNKSIGKARLPLVCSPISSISSSSTTQYLPSSNSRSSLSSHTNGPPLLAELKSCLTLFLLYVSTPLSVIAVFNNSDVLTVGHTLRNQHKGSLQLLPALLYDLHIQEHV